MTRPNILILVADTARVDDAYATDPPVMPTLTRLGEEGTRFMNAYASAPWTLPSHAALFTGMYSSKHGAHGTHPHLDHQFPTLAELFRGNGYETWAASNNTWVSGEFGFDRGFDSFWRGWQCIQSEHDVGSILHELGRLARAKQAITALGAGNPIVNAINACVTHLTRTHGDYGAQRTTDRIDSWLRSRDHETPFFGFVNYLEPHIRYAPPRSYAAPHLPVDASYAEATEIRQDPRAFDVGSYDLSERELVLLRGLYRGELAYVDDQIRRIRDTLRDVGIWEDTVLVILGDHGENIGDHGFLGHQYNVYDTLIHVPMVVTGGPFTGGGDSERLVQIPDIPPTLLEIADIQKSRAVNEMQGQSFHPDREETRETVIAEYISPQPPVERLEAQFDALPDYVYAFDRTLRTVRTKDEKLVRGSDGYLGYFRVGLDPTDEREVSSGPADRIAALCDRLDTWTASLEPATPTTEVSISPGTEQRLADLGYM